ADLHDTGILRLQGIIERGTAYESTPVKLQWSLQDSQLGQFTSLVEGFDRGLRGSLNAKATLTGTPRNLNLTIDTSIQDLRRADIVRNDAPDYRVLCNAAYVDEPSDPQSLRTIDCRSQVGNGLLTLRGSAHSLFLRPAWDISIAAADIPAAELMFLA